MNKRVLALFLVFVSLSKAGMCDYRDNVPECSNADKSDSLVRSRRDLSQLGDGVTGNETEPRKLYGKMGEPRKTL